MHCVQSRLRRIYVVGLTLVVSSAAFAADYPMVVVSATRFTDPADQLPLGIRVIDAAEIAASGTTNLAEVLARLGGIHIRNSAGDGNYQLDLRGFGATGDQNTLVLLDGQRISENEQTSARLSSIPLAAVDRIEILPGAGAVLYGSGATGGTINIITRSATRPNQLHGHLDLAIGTYASRRGNGSIDYAGDVVALSLAASDSESDNYRQNNSVDEQNFSGRLSARFDRGDVWLKFGSGKTHAGLPGPLSDVQIRSNARQSNNPQDRMSLDSSSVTMGGRLALGLTSEFAVDVARRSRDYDSIAPSFAGGASNATRVTTEALTPRMRVPYTLFGRPATLVVGADWNHWDYQRALDLPDYFYQSDLVATQKDKALYFQNRIQLTPRTHALVGARRQTTDIDMTERSFGGAPMKRSDSLNAFELGLRQVINDNWSVSARWGQSFRVANVDDNGFTASGVLLRPQTSHDAELALERAVGLARWRLAAFESRMRNEIHFIAVPASGFFNGANDNMPPTRHRGIEADGRLPLSTTLDLTTSYRYTRAEYREGLFSGFDVSGKDIPLVPEHRATIGAAWKIGAGVTANSSLRYVSRQRFDNDQVNVNPQMPSYAIMDFRVSRRLDQWTLALTVDNLFDRRYFSYGTVAAPGANGYSAYPEAGRRVALSAAWVY